MQQVEGENETEQLCFFEEMALAARSARLANAQQKALFEQQKRGADMQKLKELTERLAKDHRSPRTRRDYADDWRLFTTWCAENGFDPLPASHETIELFVSHELQRGRKTTTTSRRLHAIRAMHRTVNLPDPVKDSRANTQLSNWRKEHREESHAKAALSPDELRRIVRVMRTDEKGTRDRAIMVFGFSSALRRSELSALDLADLQISKKGVIVQIRKSKKDQEQKGATISIFAGKKPATCPVVCLRAWLKVRGKWDGPLFTAMNSGGYHGSDSWSRNRLNATAVADIVQESVQRIGLDPAHYGAHSLRAGLVTAALTSGQQAISIMKTSRHKSLAMVERYNRPKAFAVNLLAKVAL